MPLDYCNSFLYGVRWASTKGPVCSKTPVPKDAITSVYSLLYSLLSVLDPRLLSPSPDHRLPHRSKLQTVLFDMQHPTFGINSLIRSVSLMRILVSHLLATLYVRSTLSSLLSPSITPSVLTLDLGLNTPLLQVFSTMGFSIDTHWTDFTDSEPDSFSLAYRFSSRLCYVSSIGCPSDDDQLRDCLPCASVVFWSNTADIQLIWNYGLRDLHSAYNVTCFVPRTHKIFGDSFSASGPRVWNSLLADYTIQFIPTATQNNTVQSLETTVSSEGLFFVRIINIFTYVLTLCVLLAENSKLSVFLISCCASKRQL